MIAAVVSGALAISGCTTNPYTGEREAGKSGIGAGIGSLVAKAWGCAAIRLGMAFASVEIIGILSKIKYPYNVNQLTQQQAISMLHKHYEIERWVKTLKEERDYLEEEFEKLPCTIKLFPSDANFFLVKVTDAVKIYNYLVGEGIIVRNRHSVSLCCNCLRVTVGTRIENNTLLAALRKYEG